MTDKPDDPDVLQQWMGRQPLVHVPDVDVRFGFDEVGELVRLRRNARRAWIVAVAAYALQVALFIADLWVGDQRLADTAWVLVVPVAVVTIVAASFSGRAERIVKRLGNG